MRAVVLAFATTGCQLAFKLEDPDGIDATVSDPSCADPALRLCLTFENDLSAITPDLSGLGNDAELVGVTPVGRKSEQAASLTTASRITVTNINTLNFAGPLSFDAFFRMPEPPAGEFVQAVIDNSNQWGSAINTSLGFACTYLFTDRPDAITGVAFGGFVTAEWHHLACVFDPAVGVITYLDGVQRALDDRAIGGTVRTAATDGGHVHAGSFDNNTNKLIGDVDDVRVFDRVLTPAEILATVNAE